MSGVEGFEKITSLLYSQIIKEQDEATMQMLENYVKEKQRSGEIWLLNIIGEGKIRHIFNLGLTEYARIQKEPRKVLSKNYFPESVYVEFLNEEIKRLKFENKELRMQLENEEHIPHID